MALPSIDPFLANAANDDVFECPLRFVRAVLAVEIDA
jgi:hypothetical protein